MLGRQGSPSCSGRCHTYPSTANTGRLQPAGRMQRWQQMAFPVLSTAISDTHAVAGPQTPRPDYAAIDSQPLNRAIMGLFRRKMVDAIGTDSSAEGYTCAGNACQAAITALLETSNSDEPPFWPGMTPSWNSHGPSIASTARLGTHRSRRSGSCCPSSLPGCRAHSRHSPAMHLCSACILSLGLEIICTAITTRACTPGHVFYTPAGAVMPAQCMGHHADMPVAHGALPAQ